MKFNNLVHSVTHFYLNLEQYDFSYRAFSQLKKVDIKILDTLKYLLFHLKSRRSIGGCLNTMWNSLSTEKPNTMMFSPGICITLVSSLFTYEFKRLFKTQGESKVSLGFTFPFSNLQIQEGILSYGMINLLDLCLVLLWGDFGPSKSFWSSTNRLGWVQFILDGSRSFWSGPNYKKQSIKV